MRRLFVLMLVMALAFGLGVTTTAHAEDDLGVLYE